LLSVINVGTRNSISDYLANNAIPSLQDYADFLLMVHRDTLALNVEKVEKTSTANSAKPLAVKRTRTSAF
ncbi:MAG: hypothetical protein ACREGC_03950, partial [Minisyncoccia bacterium]